MRVINPTRPARWMLLFALPVLAVLAAPSVAAAQGLTLAARVPVVIPIGYSNHGGIGFAPSLNVRLGDHVALGATAGFIYYSAGDRDERDIPVLLGATYVFRDPGTLVRPYVELRAGYTYSSGAEGTPHWLTVMGGTGVLVRTARNLALDFGLDLLAPDLRGNSRDPIGLMLKVGVVYSLL
jgi:hypothetical protein